MNRFWIHNIVILIGALAILALGMAGELRQYIHPRFHIGLVLSAFVLVVIVVQETRTKQSVQGSSALVAWLSLIISMASSYQNPTPIPRVQRETLSSSSFLPTPISSSLVKKAEQKKNVPMVILSSSSTALQIISSSAQSTSSPFLQTNIPWLATQVREEKWNYSTPIEVRGQIYRSDELDKNGEIGLHRPLVTCCVADLVSIAFRMPVDSLSSFIHKDWVIVRGFLQHTGIDELYRTHERRLQLIFMDKAFLMPSHIEWIDVSIPDPYIFFAPDSKEFQEMY